jgi:hypothetical protein
MEESIRDPDGYIIEIDRAPPSSMVNARPTQGADLNTYESPLRVQKLIEDEGVGKRS